jgi:hypothetical protein
VISFPPPAHTLDLHQRRQRDDGSVKVAHRLRQATTRILEGTRSCSRMESGPIFSHLSRQPPELQSRDRGEHSRRESAGRGKWLPTRTRKSGSTATFASRRPTFDSPDPADGKTHYAGFNEAANGFSATPAAHGLAARVVSKVASFKPCRFASATRCASVVSFEGVSGASVPLTSSATN